MTNKITKLREQLAAAEKSLAGRVARVEKLKERQAALRQQETAAKAPGQTSRFARCPDSRDHNNAKLALDEALEDLADGRRRVDELKDLLRPFDLEARVAALEARLDAIEKQPAEPTTVKSEKNGPIPNVLTRIFGGAA